MGPAALMMKMGMVQMMSDLRDMKPSGALLYPPTSSHHLLVHPSTQRVTQLYL